MSLSSVKQELLLLVIRGGATQKKGKCWDPLRMFRDPRPKASCCLLAQTEPLIRVQPKAM